MTRDEALDNLSAAIDTRDVKRIQDAFDLFHAEDPETAERILLACAHNFNLNED